MGNDGPDDYYALLGIDAGADHAKVRRAWRQLALQWHPDRAGPGATARFQKISVAYAVLSDPVARAAYDRRRGTPEKGPPPVSSRRRAPAVLLSRLSGSLKALLTGGVARRAEGDVIELFLNAEEAAQGGMVTISMRVQVRCPDCAPGAAQCSRCGARGRLEELFSAWLAVPPEVADGAVLAPSELLRGMVRPVRFRIRIRARS